MKIIRLTQGKCAKVSNRDYKRVSARKWQARLNNGTWYAISTIYSMDGTGSRKTELMHRFILGLTTFGKIVDHRDRDGLNNTRRNLRISNKSKNGMNRGKQSNNNSGFKGVSCYEDRWQASIKLNGKSYALGHFNDPEKAARAYDAAARRMHGIFSNVNFA